LVFLFFRVTIGHMTQKKIQAFQKTIWNYYQNNHRDFPWRDTKNPYRIFVSEVMLQQTQTHRVIEKYKEFIRMFPNFVALAHAPFKKIFSVWRGLGYNRRALFLKKASEIIVKKYRGKLSQSIDELTALPGIGYNTACSILAFAFNKPVVFIETNIRSIFIHFFFARKKSVHDRDILALIKQTLDTKNPREWYWALMDYGAMLKKTHPNPSRKSAHHIRQTPFKNSDRQIRGKILALLAEEKYSTLTIKKKIGAGSLRIPHILKNLIREGLIRKQKSFHTLT